MYTSPSNEKFKKHFSDIFLKKLALYYNKSTSDKNDKIIIDKNIYKSLKQKMKKYKVQDQYWHWPYIIRKLNTSTKVIKDIKKYENIELIPERPASWYRNPRTWLSNFEIQNVLILYKNDPKFKYNLLGVFPIDFSISDSNGTCMYSKFCTIDIKQLSKKHSFIGFVTNLDKHDEPGSHWTSTFIVINPKLPTYGAYYYDSSGQKEIPIYLRDFMNSIQIQCETMYPRKKFNIITNNKKHQFKNTECGMFSILFQIRWLNKHIVKKNKTSFQEIISNPFIDDDNMVRLRQSLFRPNSSFELKNINI